MPQLIPFYFMNEVVFTFTIISIILYVLCVRRFGYHLAAHKERFQEDAHNIEIDYLIVPFL